MALNSVVPTFPEAPMTLASSSGLPPMTMADGSNYAVAPKTTIWQNITTGANAVSSVLQAGAQVYNAIAPKTTYVQTQSGSANPIPTGSSQQPQSAPVVNIAQTPNGNLSQGSNSAPIDNNLLLIGGGAILLIVVIMMFKK